MASKARSGKSSSFMTASIQPSRPDLSFCALASSRPSATALTRLAVGKLVAKLVPFGVLAPFRLDDPDPLLEFDFVLATLSLCILPTNSSIAATLLFISFILVLAGCVLALELRPLSPLIPSLRPFPFVCGRGESMPRGSREVSRIGESEVSPFRGISRVYWLRPNRPRRAGGRPPLRPAGIFAGGVDSFIDCVDLVTEMVGFSGDNIGEGGGESIIGQYNI